MDKWPNIQFLPLHVVVENWPNSMNINIEHFCNNIYLK